MSRDNPTFAEIAEENIRQKWNRCNLAKGCHKLTSKEAFEMHLKESYK